MAIHAWLSAFRLRTLPLSLSCVLMGTFLAMDAGYFDRGVFALCILTTVLLQVLSNLANDYGDSVNGADNADRKGPQRAVQSGAISPRQMKRAIIVLAVLCLDSGLALLWVAFGADLKSFLVFFLLGLLSILAAITYTMGRRPYGYAGLGDLSVLVFFGFVGVLGTAYLFTKGFRSLDLLPALSCGLFSVAVLNVNNIRDIESDARAGKHSIPVRVGREKAVHYHWFLLGSGCFFAVLFTGLHFQSFWQWIFLLSFPLFYDNAKAIMAKEPMELDPYLRQMALSTLVFVLLFGTGLLMGQ